MKKLLQPSYKIIIIGNIAAGKSIIAEKIASELKIPYYSIDASRRKIADGTIAGEYDAYADFLRNLQEKNTGIYEFSGVGIHKYAVRYILQAFQYPFVILWVKCPLDLCFLRRERLGKVSKLPYPFPITLEESISYNEKELTKKGALNFWKIPGLTHKIICIDNSSQWTSKTEKADIFHRIISKVLSELSEFQTEIMEGD